MGENNEVFKREIHLDDVINLLEDLFCCFDWLVVLAATTLEAV